MKNASCLVGSALSLALWLLGTPSGHCFCNPVAPGQQPRFAADSGAVAPCQPRPSGELIRATGPAAKANPSQLLTKCQHIETDYPYYGFRYYNPSTGRWLNRDPKEEKHGGNNLYAFSENNPVSVCDPVGLSPMWYSLQVAPNDPDDPTHLAVYPNAIILPISYPNSGSKCGCRGRLMGVAMGAAWIDLSTSFGLKDLQPDYYNKVISPWPHWGAAEKRIFENPKYVGAGFTAIINQPDTGARACCRNFVWYNYIVRHWWWDKPDGRFTGNQFLDSPGGLRPPAVSFSRTYKLVLKCEDPDWPSEELGTWYWGLDMQFGIWTWTANFYPPTAEASEPWPL